MERKKLIELIGAVFIAVIFLSSYVSLSIFTNSKTTTTVLQNTVFASGFTNTIITGYGQIVNINVQCSNSMVSDNTSSFIGNAMTGLENNDSISNYYTIGDKITVQSGTKNAYQIYNYTKKELTYASDNCTSFSGTGMVALPQVMPMSIGNPPSTYSIVIPNSSRVYYLPLTFSSNMRLKVRVKVNTLVNSTGYVYGNITVVRAPSTSSTTTTIKPPSNTMQANKTTTTTSSNSMSSNEIATSNTIATNSIANTVPANASK